MSAPITLFLVDDHDVVRRGLRELLEAQPGWQVVGEARTGREAVALAERLRPDVAVLDLSMPELNGLEATCRIRKDRLERAAHTGRYADHPRELSSAVLNK